MPITVIYLASKLSSILMKFEQVTPCSGVATTEQIIEAVMEGFGMSLDVAAFLASYGTVHCL